MTKPQARMYIDIPWVEPEEFIVAVSQLQEMVQYLMERDAGIQREVNDTEP